MASGPDAWRTSAKAQEEKGLPPGLKFWTPFPFAGMNLKDSPLAIADQEFLWLENYFRVGQGYMRAGWDVGAKLYTAPPNRTIVSFFFYNLGVNYFAAVFLDDGSAVQVAMDRATKLIGGPGQFYQSTNGQLAACQQYGVQYLLISNRNTQNDYWAWDGTILYKAGSVAPDSAIVLAGGENYNSVPTVTIYGGHGSGIQLTPEINAGGVVFLKITNPGSGYEIGDNPQIAFSGGGSDNSAILQASLNSGGVSAVEITAAGSSYTTATVSFSGGGGSGATATATIGSGVSSVAVTNGGAGYTGANVTFSGGGGTGATGTAIVNGGQVVEIDVSDPGTGYSSAPTVVIAGDGTGATATATVQNGAIVAITVTDPGTGYTSAPTVIVTGDGSGATAVAVLNSSSLSGVTVVNPGTGFVSVPLITFVGGGGTNATGIVELVGTSIATINVDSPGSGYLFPGSTNVQIIGGGANGKDPSNKASASPIIVDGQIVAITVNNGGSGYETTPAININVDNIGKGTTAPTAIASATAVFAPTSIASVQISNYGQHYTDAPAVVVSPGANNSAYASLSLMPFGVSGGSMETFGGRVWIAYPAPPQFGDTPPGGDWQVTAPASLTDFATSDGGLLFTNSDGFLQTRYTAFKQSNGYLYAFGDGSVSVISNVQTAGNPTTTTLTYQNVDPQAGASWRDSLQDFGRTILSANETGVYGLYGGAMTKASEKLDQLFNTALFPPTAGALTPSAATATLFNVKHFLMLMTAVDPQLGPRNVMIAWNEKEWSIASQSVALTYIGAQKVESKFTAWGTDGTSLYPLFQEPSATLVKRMDTKIYGGDSILFTKDVMGMWMQAQDYAGEGLDFSLNFNVSGLAIQNENFPSISSGVYSDSGGKFTFQPAEFPAPPPAWPVWGAGTPGLKAMMVGLQLSTTSADFALANLVVGYIDDTAFM